MKKSILFITLIYSSMLSISQYTFSKTTGTYTDLVGSTSLTNGTTWDDPQLTIPLGFSFQYFDSTISTIYIEDYGVGAELAINSSETGIIPSLSPFDEDLVDRSFDVNSGNPSTGGTSPISYLLTGTAGSRIMKIEWKNAGFYEDIDDDGTSVDFVNFQVWLYEGSNNIEFHYGPNSISQPQLCYESGIGAIVVLYPAQNYLTGDSGPNVINLTQAPTAPIIKIINSFDSLGSLNATIPNGTIYQFTKSGGSVSINESDLDFKIKIYPNPAISILNINNIENRKITNVSIIDVSGKLVISKGNFVNKTMNIETLENGVYFLKIESKDGIALKRFMKQ